MRNIRKSIIAALLLITFILSTFVPAVAAGDQPSSYSKTYNSGERDVVCTTLDGTSADDYYTNSYEYENLEELSSSALLSTLRGLMTSTHKKTSSYADCRDMAVNTDCENEDGRVVLIYTSYSATRSQYNGWNREHVWPQSLGGGNTSGGGADLHHIRPSDAGVNSSRGNKKYGEAGSSPSTKYGSNPANGVLGGYYNSTYFEPLDNVKGDVARICLYVWVRWGSAWGAENVTEVFQSIDVLLEWCELDPVDTWEMGRNEVVEAYQGNRNVFIDYPELAWLLFDREVPDDMVTPSGEAMNGSGSGSGDTEDGNGGSDSDTGGGSTDTPAACTHSTAVVKNKTEATCNKVGYSGDTYCDDCDVKLSSGNTIPALGHDWTEPVVKHHPTETEPGQTECTCTVCGINKVSTIPPLGVPAAYWETTEEMILVMISKQAFDCLFLDYLSKD